MALGAALEPSRACSGSRLGLIGSDFVSHLALSRQSPINLPTPLRNGEGPPHFHLSAGKARGPFVPDAAQPFSEGPGLDPTPLLNLVLIKIFFLA